jgi:glycosyltransferase involved in cell wall biosynthesis
MEKKRVTLLINSLSGGGAEGVCINLANGLVEKGWDIDLLVLNLNNAAYKNRVSHKVNIIDLGVNHARYAFFPLLSYIKRNTPRKILVFNYELTVILVLYRIFMRFKFEIIARNINTISLKQQQEKGVWRKYIVIPLINKFYCSADYIINQCDAMRDDLIRFYPNVKAKLGVIYNPVAMYIEEYINRSDDIPIEHGDYILCVGRLEKQKAFHYAIEAFSIISKDYPELRLKLVGQGSLDIDLKYYAKVHGVEEKVDFEGFQEKIIPYYLNAKATVLTSLYEGFPNALVESITLGTPIISFDCPSGPKEIILEGVNGYLVPYQNKELLVENLRKILNDDWCTAIVSETASKYKFDLIIDEYIKVLS